MATDPHPPLRVLVVDDDELAAQSLAELLTESGYDAVPLTSGEEALASAEAHHPACALVDVRMPGMNGVELSRRLRELYHGAVTVIAMTGADSGSAEYQAMLGECDHLLSKPIDLARLTRVLPPAR